MICLDTSPVIWAVQRQARAGQEDKILRTQEYLRQAAAAGTPIAIPAPAVFEFLTGYPDAVQRGEVRRVLEKGFPIPAFDTPAASVAADVHADAPLFRAAVAAAGDRQRVKFDVTIIGTAVAVGATELFTDDPHMVDLAGGRIRVVLVRDIPLPPPVLPFPDAGPSV